MPEPENLAQDTTNLDAPALLQQASAKLSKSPDDVEALLLSAVALRQMREHKRATLAEKAAIQILDAKPQVRAATAALEEGSAEEAERQVRSSVARSGMDPVALRLLALLEIKRGRVQEAVPHLTKALRVAPSFEAARETLIAAYTALGMEEKAREQAEISAAARGNDAQSAVPLLERIVRAAPGSKQARQALADAYSKLGRREEALEQAEALIAKEPDDPAFRVLKANILDGMARFDEAIEVWRGLISRFPEEVGPLVSSGHDLATVGRIDEAAAAFRAAITLRPHLGAAWWSLANLQTVRFDDTEVEQMRDLIRSGRGSIDDRLAIHFALGKAMEDRKVWTESFANYEEGNRLRRSRLDYDPEAGEAVLERHKAVFTPQYFASRQGSGHQAHDPIFVVGMQRSGSTLVEQILASHPQVEGLFELPDIPVIARGLGNVSFGLSGSAYPETVAELDADALSGLGGQYIERTGAARTTDRPFFIDKLPNNWMHIGLIRSILPNARIVDVRRHPLDCCFSNFKQLYSREQRFTYDLAELGRYYRSYVGLMRHFDEVLPGRVHRIIYESLVDDPEAEVRRLLDYLGLPFDPACLNFFANERAVRTPSAEQVRQPINQRGIGRWRPYELWLEPLERALGPVLTAYPEVPRA